MRLGGSCRRRACRAPSCNTRLRHYKRDRDNGSQEQSYQHALLIKEYDSAIQLTYHIDELRNNLTRFYITFAGVATAAVAFLLKDEAKHSAIPDIGAPVVFLLLIVAVKGALVVRGLARLRSVQLESFFIINSIRSHIFGHKNYDIWNVVRLSSKTLPKPSRKSGTYVWVLLVVLTSSAIFAAFCYLTVAYHLPDVGYAPNMLVSCMFFASYGLALDAFYFYSVNRPSVLAYSETNTPVD